MEWIKKNPNKSALIVLFVIYLGYTTIVFFKSNISFNPFESNIQRPTPEEIEVARQGEIDAIRNRTFPLAGGPNDAGMETGDDVVPINKEPPLRRYSVAENSITTTEKFVISTKGYNLGNTATEKYGYSLPVTNGTYVDMQFDLENTQKQTALLNMTNIKYIDQEGREYLPIRQLSGCPNTISTKDSSEISVMLGPSVPCTASLLFEVSTSSISYHIEFFAP